VSPLNRDVCPSLRKIRLKYLTRSVILHIFSNSRWPFASPRTAAVFPLMLLQGYYVNLCSKLAHICHALSLWTCYTVTRACWPNRLAEVDLHTRTTVNEGNKATPNSCLLDSWNILCIYMLYPPVTLSMCFKLAAMEAFGKTWAKYALPR